MELILDTCGFLSLVGLSERRLSRVTLRKIEDAEQIYVSSCSLFEIAIKNKKGNLSVRPFGNVLELWETAVEEYRLTELDVSAHVFFGSVELPNHHGDPFDRIVIFEALSRKLAVITYDAVFDRYGVETMD